MCINRVNIILTYFYYLWRILVFLLSQVFVLFLLCIIIGANKRILNLNLITKFTILGVATRS